MKPPSGGFFLRGTYLPVPGLALFGHGRICLTMSVVEGRADVVQLPSGVAFLTPTRTSEPSNAGALERC